MGDSAFLKKKDSSGIPLWNSMCLGTILGSSKNQQQQKTKTRRVCWALRDNFHKYPIE